MVLSVGGDPVQLGLVGSFNRPEGNVTGATFLGALWTMKQLQLLHELVPAATKMAFLMNPEIVNAAGETGDAQTSTKTLGVTLKVVRARSENELEAGFVGLAAAQVGALVVDSDVFIFSRRDRIVALAARYAI